MNRKHGIVILIGVILFDSWALAYGIAKLDEGKTIDGIVLLIVGTPCYIFAIYSLSVVLRRKEVISN